MRILCVMDPLKKLNPKWDNSLFILSELQERGHECWIADIPDLVPKAKTLQIRATRLLAKPKHCKGPVQKAFFACGRENHDIKNFDLVLIRKEPPVNEKFISMTFLLEKFAGTVPMVNHPRGIRETNEKLSILNFPCHIPLTFVSKSPEEILKFRERAGGDIVVKPLNLKGGKGVFRVTDSSAQTVKHLRRATRQGREALMAQQFLEAKQPVEKRIVLLKGKVLAAYEKRPRPGEFRANLDLGASFHPTVLTAAEKRIVRDLRGYLLKNGLFFVGIDVLNGKLLEINVTCPAGVTEAKFLQPNLRPERAWAGFLEDFAR